MVLEYRDVHSKAFLKISKTIMRLSAVQNQQVSEETFQSSTLRLCIHTALYCQCFHLETITSLVWTYFLSEYQIVKNIRGLF